MRIINNLWLTLGLVFLSQTVCFAEQPIENSTTSSNEQLASRLPMPDARLSNGVLIGNFNEQFRLLVIPELRDFIRDGQLNGEAYLGLPYTIDSGLRCCLDQAGDFQVSNQGLLNRLPGKLQGQFFSPNDDINLTTAQLGYRALWNIQGLWLNQNYINTNIRLRYIRNNSVFREVGAEYSQVFPRQFNLEDTTGQVARSMLRVSTPPLVKDFAWLQFRFYAEDEDVIFMYSPVIKKVRELTGSNASDSLISSSVSINDLLLWTQKINTVDVLSIAEDVFLVPLVVGRLSDSKTAAGCNTVTSLEFESNDQPVWNYLSRRFPNAAPWLTGQAIYVPRKLTRLFLETNDPYSLYGRQILYIDQQTGLPIYKIVFDTAGSLWKIIISQFAFPPTESTGLKFYPHSQVLIDLKLPQVTLIEHLTFQSCNAEVAAKQLDNFIPQNLNPKN